MRDFLHNLIRATLNGVLGQKTSSSKPAPIAREEEDEDEVAFIDEVGAATTEEKEEEEEEGDVDRMDGEC